MRTSNRGFVVALAFILIAASISMPGLLYFKYYDLPSPSDIYATAEISLNVIAYVCGDSSCDTGNGESCSLCPEDCGVCPVSTSTSTGGGGGSSTSRKINFKFIPNMIQEDLYQGTSKTEKVNISNTGYIDFKINLEVSDEIKSLTFLNKNSFDVDARKSEEFEATLSTSKDEEPGVYFGGIVGTAGTVTRELSVLISVFEEGAPFIVDVKIPEESKVITPGESVIGEINIRNELHDVMGNVEYSLMNKEKEIFNSKSDVLDLNFGNNYFVEELETKENIPPGNYIFYVKLTYGDTSYFDAATFKVDIPTSYPGIFFERYAIIGLIVFFVLVIISSIYIYGHKRKRRKAPKKEKKVVVEEELEEKSVDYLRLVNSTIAKIKRFKKIDEKHYSHSSLDEYLSVMRNFFSKYYSLKHSFTFQELIKHISEIRTANKQGAISFVKVIEHIPYSRDLIIKTEFDRLLNKTLTLLEKYQRIVGKRTNKNAHKSKKKKKRKQ